MRRIIVLILTTLFFAFDALPQGQSMRALGSDFPLLTRAFGNELEEEKADYIFVVDVSGTMQNYQSIVVPALQEFFRSLEEGDYVSLIKFGGAARSELAGYGTIRSQTRNSLIDYAPRLYDYPSNPADKHLYYNYTDLSAMMDFLADDMKQIGRNRLKFVFILTDFVHDPSPQRRGNESWPVIARRLEMEQSENDICMFALQLPGRDSGRDFDKMRETIPRSFDFEYQQITDGPTLSEWFRKKKNEILLDKLSALVHRKMEDVAFAASAHVTIDGKTRLDVSWKPNELFDVLSVDTVLLGRSGFRFGSRLPQTVDSPGKTLDAGVLAYHKRSFPFYHFLHDTLQVVASLVAPWQNELLRLGIENQQIITRAPVERGIFTFLLPFWLTMLILALLILYILLVVKAAGRNGKNENKINGTFVVGYDGEELLKSRVYKAAEKVDIGNGGTDLPVSHADCNWRLEYYYKTYSPFRCFKKPEYRLRLLRGSRFKTSGRQYVKHQSPPIGKGAAVTIDNFSIRWILTPGKQYK
ncbi:MAG: VWA domain-containing protein [Tannerellaceae bacterium]|nr:VWA domain-containing protein [Tannerellaceae bacterium]